MNLHNTVLSAPKPTTESTLRDRLFETRRLSSDLAAPLSDEDQVVQAMDDASPTKWHLAHTTWFFEAFLLKRFLPGYRVFDERFEYCFNSYYESVGARQPRAKRGLLTRPSAQEVRDYRAFVDAALARLFDQKLTPEARRVDRARHQSRAAAPGAAAHRYARACSPPNRSSPRTARPVPGVGCRRRGAARLDRVRRRHLSRSAMTARASPTTMKARATRR